MNYELVMFAYNNFVSDNFIREVFGIYWFDEVYASSLIELLCLIGCIPENNTNKNYLFLRVASEISFIPPALIAFRDLGTVCTVLTTTTTTLIRLGEGVRVSYTRTPYQVQLFDDCWSRLPLCPFRLCCGAFCIPCPMSSLRDYIFHCCLETLVGRLVYRQR